MWKLILKRPRLVGVKLEAASHHSGLNEMEKKGKLWLVIESILITKFILPQRVGDHKLRAKIHVARVSEKTSEEITV